MDCCRIKGTFPKKCFNKAHFKNIVMSIEERKLKVFVRIIFPLIHILSPPQSKHSTCTGQMTSYLMRKCE